MTPSEECAPTSASASQPSFEGSRAIRLGAPITKHPEWAPDTYRGQPMQTIDAFRLGFIDRLQSGTFGRTWDDNQDFNEAYDRGMNAAEELFAL